MFPLVLERRLRLCHHARHTVAGRVPGTARLSHFPGVTMDRPLIKLLLVLLAIVLAAIAFLAAISVITGGLAWAIPVAVIALGIAVLL